MTSEVLPPFDPIEGGSNYETIAQQTPDDKKPGSGFNPDPGFLEFFL
jgi:hypothetical protein